MKSIKNYFKFNITESLIFKLSTLSLIVLMTALVFTLLRSAITPSISVFSPNEKIILYESEYESISQWISPERKVICYIYNDYAYGNNSMDCFSSVELNFLQLPTPKLE